jgi:hypothetical protein
MFSTPPTTRSLLRLTMSDPVDPKCVTPHPHTGACGVAARMCCLWSLAPGACSIVGAQSLLGRPQPPPRAAHATGAKLFAPPASVRKHGRSWTLQPMPRVVPDCIIGPDAGRPRSARRSWLHALGVLRGGSIESSPHMPGVAARNSGPGSNCSRRMADTVPYMDAAWARILYCSRRGT